MSVLMLRINEIYKDGAKHGVIFRRDLRILYSKIIKYSKDIDKCREDMIMCWVVNAGSINPKDH